MQKAPDHEEKATYNAWTVGIPAPVKRMENLPEDSELLVLILNGKAEAFIITDVTSTDEFIQEWLVENREVDEKLRIRGD